MRIHSVNFSFKVSSTKVTEEIQFLFKLIAGKRKLTHVTIHMHLLFVLNMQRMFIAEDTDIKIHQSVSLLIIRA